jgi:hypothetical protein
MGKRRLISLLLASSLSVFIASSFIACDSANEPEEVPSELIASDYFRNEDNQTWIARVVGTMAEFEANGQQSSLETMDDDRKVVLGAQQTINGLGMRPLFAFNADGSQSDHRPAFYLGTKDGKLILISRDWEHEITVLPRDLATGSTWIPHDTMPKTLTSTYTITEYYKEFTNNAGKKYSDVIKTVATFRDSAYTDPQNGQIGVGTLESFFAKGVGPIEFHIPTLTIWEEEDGETRRMQASGKLSRKN